MAVAVQATPCIWPHPCAGRQRRPFCVKIHVNYAARNRHGCGTRPAAGGGSLPPPQPPGAGAGWWPGDGDRWNAPWHPWALVLALASALALARRAAAPHLHRGSPQDGPSVSVIVPALNEAQGLPALLEHLRHLDPPAAEVIVVDGGSTDGTPRVARRHGASRVLSSPRGRAAQMNAGAGAAGGELLLFVHADSRPPREAVAVARRVLAAPQAVLGGFFVRLEEPEGQVLLLPTLHNFVKTYYAPLAFRPLSFVRGLRLLFGDQSLFCRAADFRRVGGFNAALPIMEDADLCLRLHDAGPAGTGANAGGRGRIVQVCRPSAQSSGRRIAALGFLTSTYVQWAISWAWYWGASPQRLRQMYNQMYGDARCATGR